MFIDDINFFGDASLSTQQSSIDDFSTQVIPNPATVAESRLQIGLTKSESVSVQLMDVSGKIIARKELGLLSPGEYNVNLAEFTAGDSKAGVYFVQIDAGSFAITRKWLCIE